MTVTTTAQTIFDFSWTTSKSDDIATTTESKSLKEGSRNQFGSGSGDGEVEQVYRERRTLTAASATDDIDLTQLRNPFGELINFSAIKVIYVKNREAASGTQMRVGGAGTDAWVGPFGDTSAYIVIDPSDEFAMTNRNSGWVVDESNKLLRITHENDSAGDLDYDLVLIGVS